MHNVGIESDPSVAEQALSGPQDLTAARSETTAAVLSQYWADWLHRSLRYEMHGPGGRVLVKDKEENVKI